MRHSEPPNLSRGPPRIDEVLVSARLACCARANEKQSYPLRINRNADRPRGNRHQR